MIVMVLSVIFVVAELGLLICTILTLVCKFKNRKILKDVIQMCRKTPSFSCGDIRRVHRIYR